MLQLSAQVITEIEEGLVIIIVGMGVVFFFLTIMVFAMQIMSAVVNFLNKIFPAQQIEVPKRAKKILGIDDEVAVAIAVAASQK
jgi:sodium pump decarboxylase gamma subunit